MPRPPNPLGALGEISYTSAGGTVTADARIRLNTGQIKRIRRTGSSRTAAMNALKAFASTLVREGSSDHIARDMRFIDLAAMWWSSVNSDLSDTTALRYEAAIRPSGTPKRHGGVKSEGYLITELGGYRLHEIRTSEAQRCLDAIALKRGAATAKMCRTVLIHILEIAVADDAIMFNPAKNTKAPKQERKPVVAYSPDEMREIRLKLDGIDEARHLGVAAVWSVLCGTGCRIGEALALHWDDVNFGEPMTISIRKTVTVNRSGRAVLGDRPKSWSSIRDLRVPDYVRAALLHQKSQYVEHDLGLVFPSSALTVRDPGNFRGQLTRLLPGVDPERIRPHTVRRSIGTAIANEMGLGAASKSLGHSSESITSKHYVKRDVMTPDVREVTNLF